MPDMTDLRLNDPSGHSAADDMDAYQGSDGVAPQRDSSDGPKWIVLAVLLVVAAAVLSYVGYTMLKRRTPAAVATPASTPAPAAAKTGPLVEADNIPLPPLSQTDALVRQLVVKLTSHPKALAWLATDGLLDNFMRVTVTTSEGHSPVSRLRTLAPQSPFSVLKTNRGVFVDPKSYHRYDEYAAAVSGLDPAGTARLYLTLKPRITDAYRTLETGDTDFDRVLERAIGVLLNTPVVEGEIALTPRPLSYRYADPALESLTGAQKQLLRMGPDNMRRVQAQLKEIARQLGLKP